ncbi:sporulation protein YtxC [Terribacillus saccharophilus]|uniref:sporulation protein YtxC n=1 Tax=Terribacillus saccharophilus TaxID=361277 RepID=UPI00398203DC
MFIKSKQEMDTFCSCLTMLDNTEKVYVDEDERWGYAATIHDGYHQRIALALVETFLYHRETDWIKQVAREVYYFKDEEAIKRIAELTHTMIVGDRYEEAKEPSLPRQRITKSFQEIAAKHLRVFYDAVIQFRSSGYKEALIEIVGDAIEEYKLEEEYQLYVENLREYIGKKTVQPQVIHVIQGQDFSFYKDEGTRFSNEEINAYAEEEPLFLAGIGKQEKNITPLIAMSPQKIYLYGDQPSEPKTLTVINIFQERAVYLPLHQFPFSRY